MILIAIVLIGVLTAAIQYSSRPEGSNIDKETLVIRATEVQRMASELERAILFILQNGKSESDIRFAHPEAPADYGDLSADSDPSDQIFDRTGGGAEYRAPPPDVNDGSPWEFYGGTHVPGVGSDQADLVAVLPNVTPQFCDKINELNGQSGTPADTGTAPAAGPNAGDCVYQGTVGRFEDGQKFYTTPNTMDETTFEQDPETSTTRTALQACVVCDIGPARHFYHVLLAR
ncbi:MAG: hypothetical protein K9G62_02170 [Alphaproteobacteria bacterium]|nr:hypothetical protein [Alphaproteobacteria bacterium]